MKLQRTLMVVAVVLAVGASNGVQAQIVLLNETFNSVNTLTAAGWFFQNNSVDPDPTGAWRQGDALSDLNTGGPPSPPAGSFAQTSYSATSLVAPTGANLNDWMLTPALVLNNGDTINFFVRTFQNTAFPENLQVRITTAGDSINVGTNDQDEGDYTELLLDINPSLTLGAFPESWAAGQFNIVLSGLTGPTTTRIAFRHFLPDSGQLGDNGDEIAFDSLVVTAAAVPEPATLAMMGSALLGGLYVYCRRLQLKWKALESEVESRD